MAFTNDPSRAIDRVRMRVGDTSTLNEHIKDDWYKYYLDQKANNETLAAIEAAKAILAKFTGNTREVTDQVEIYGNQQFEQYLKWLKDFIENPSLSGLRSPMPYAGGISRADIEANRSNNNNVGSRAYEGFTEDPYADSGKSFPRSDYFRY